MDTSTHDRHALYLLLSLLASLVIGAFVTHDRRGEAILSASLCAVLGAAALELSEKRALRRPGILLSGVTAGVMILVTFYPSPSLVAASWALLMISLAFIAVNLFLYLGKPGRITNGRLYASVSLYLMIAAVFFALFNLMETLKRGSFSESGLSAGAPVSRHSMMYFSLVTLTTLGYGDVVPVSHPARMFAALEAVTGVLYMAITVARLVAGYQMSGESKD
jgi:Ion channel